MSGSQLLPLAKASLLFLCVVSMTMPEARRKDFQKGSCGHPKMQAEKPRGSVMNLSILWRRGSQVNCQQTWYPRGAPVWELALVVH